MKPAAGRKESGVKYLALVEKHIESIWRLHDTYRDKRPVMLLELPTMRIYAYPYKGFLRSLSARSQTLLREEYAHAQAEDKVVLFVRDNARRKLVSFSIG